MVDLDPRRWIDAPLDGSAEPTLPAVRSGDQGRRSSQDGDSLAVPAADALPETDRSGVDVRPGLPVELVRPRIARRAAGAFHNGWQLRAPNGRRPLYFGSAPCRRSADSRGGSDRRWRGRGRKARGVPRARARPRAAGSANRAAAPAASPRSHGARPRAKGRARRWSARLRGGSRSRAGAGTGRRISCAPTEPKLPEPPGEDAKFGGPERPLGERGGRPHLRRPRRGGRGSRPPRRRRRWQSRLRRAALPRPSVQRRRGRGR